MPSPVRPFTGVASVALAFTYEKASRESNIDTPLTIRPVAPSPVSVLVVGITGVRGMRYTVAVLEGKLGKLVVFAASRYHGPMMCEARPVVRMYTQLAEELISFTSA